MSIHNLIQLHREHQYWLHELDLYQDETKYFQNRLARLAAQEPDAEEVDHFRQEFIKAIHQVDVFRHQIYTHEVQIAKRMELANRTKEHLAPEENHHKLRRSIEEFSLAFKALKMNGNEFMANKA